jgi:SAM-dependent methyltransferase
MRSGFIDALTSPTLKHLREQWWDDEFTGFLVEMLKPRPGTRMLDVGCGAGAAEVSIGHMHVSQLRQYGVDIKVSEVLAAAREAAAHNQRAQFAAADAVRLPFRNEVFDSTYCVAVLQHIADVNAAVAEIARVTRVNGRLVAVEPDNSARYCFSSLPAGTQTFEAAARFFALLKSYGPGTSEPAIGPKLPAFFARHGVDVLDVRLFPVSFAQVGNPGQEFWAERRAQVARLTSQPTPELRALGTEYLAALDVYAGEAEAAGPAFVEIQNTMLFATVGQRAQAAPRNANS